MTEAYQQALACTDPKIIKQVRAFHKGKVSRSVSSLKAVLAENWEDSNRYDLANINVDEVEDLIASLKYAYQAVENLHAKFMVYRVHSEDDEEEEELIAADENYMDEVDNKYREGLKMYNSYMTQYKTSIGIPPEAKFKTSSAVAESATVETAVVKSSNILKLKILNFRYP